MSICIGGSKNDEFNRYQQIGSRSQNAKITSSHRKETIAMQIHGIIASPRKSIDEKNLRTNRTEMATGIQIIQLSF